MASTRMNPRIQQIAVTCHHCGRSHTVSCHAKSTVCPTCQAYIEIGDLTISSKTSRRVDIRGKLIIKKNALLTCQQVVCTDAIIEGSLAGAILCEKSLEFRGKTRLTFRVMANEIFVAKRANVSCSVPILTKKIVIEGSLIAHIVADEVHIKKSGLLHGNIEAQSITVERGGEWVGRGKTTSLPSLGKSLQAA